MEHASHFLDKIMVSFEENPQKKCDRKLARCMEHASHFLEEKYLFCLRGKSLERNFDPTLIRCVEPSSHFLEKIVALRMRKVPWKEICSRMSPLDGA